MTGITRLYSMKPTKPSETTTRELQLVSETVRGPSSDSERAAAPPPAMGVPPETPTRTTARRARALQLLPLQPPLTTAVHYRPMCATAAAVTGVSVQRER
jgi:hypothetical protein